MDDQIRNDEAAIRALIEAQAEALRAKDVEGVMRPCAPDAMRFDLEPPLAHPGDPARDRREHAEWFATWRGGLGYEIRDLQLTVADGIAFGHGFICISGTKTDGKTASVWARRTIGLRRLRDGWKIVHDHVSVPFYMDGSCRAAVDLAP